MWSLQQDRLTDKIGWQMDKQELRLRLVECVSKANNMFKSEAVLDAVKNYEAYITSGNEDKVSTPSDAVKVQRKGSTVSTKKKPRIRVK